MTSNTTRSATDTAQEQHSDAAPLSILASWEKVFRAYLVKARLAKDVIKADLTLSVEAILVSAICLIAVVGISLIIWVTLLVTLGYGLVALGAHWLFIPVVILVANIALLWCVYIIFSRAKEALNINASIDLLTDGDKSQKE